MRARQRKKNYKKIHGFNPPKAFDCNPVINSINEEMLKITSVVKKWIAGVSEVINTVEKNIKEMPEEEFNEKISCSELTLDQIAMAKIIRYGRKKKQ